MSKLGNKKEEIIRFFNEGLSNREMAKRLNVHHSSITYWLKKLNLKRSQPKIEMVDECNAKCSKCGKIKSVKEFTYNRANSIRQYQLTYCKKCRRKQVYRAVNANLGTFLKTTLNKKKIHSNKKGIEFNLDLEFVLTIYEKQNGKCLYSGIELTIGVGNGLQNTTLSYDRVNPNKGYTKDNVVLASYRFNSVKRNLTIEELKKIYTFVL